jgi:hypothetical protein
MQLAPPQRAHRIPAPSLPCFDQAQLAGLLAEERRAAYESIVLGCQAALA